MGPLKVRVELERNGMCDHGTTTEPVEEQGSFWDHQTPGWSSLWSRSGGEDGFPDPHTPGWISLWSPKGEDDSFSNHCQENQGLSLFLAIGKFGRSQAVGTEQCGTLGQSWVRAVMEASPSGGVTLGRGGPNRRQ